MADVEGDGGAAGGAGGAGGGGGMGMRNGVTLGTLTCAVPALGVAVIV